MPRFPQLIVREDASTGLKLLSELREEPGGIWSNFYVFRCDRNLPGHMLPADAFDRAAAEQAFDQIVNYLNTNKS